MVRLPSFSKIFGKAARQRDKEWFAFPRILRYLVKQQDRWIDKWFALPRILRYLVKQRDRGIDKWFAFLDLVRYLVKYSVLV
jgi:hypothetical protein